MAYAAAITNTRQNAPGRVSYLVTIVETEAAASSEYTVTGLPARCTLMSLRATLTGGTGTTVQPALGNAAEWVAGDPNERGVANAAAASVVISDRIHLDLTDGTLYGRSTVDAGADNDITTVLRIVDGWL